MSDAISINVSGRRFDIGQETFYKISQVIGSKIQSTPASFTQGRKEYFFERHPDAFQTILYYFQTGELHMPQCLCPSLYEKELEFWGIEPTFLSRCCYNTYSQAMDNKARLTEFETYFKYGKKLPTENISRREKLRQFGWKLMNDPFSSLAAEIYFWISISLVIMSVTVICVSTHPNFRGQIPLYQFPSWLQDYIIRHYGIILYHTANTTNVSYSEFIGSDEVKVTFQFPYLFVTQVALYGYFSVEICCLLILSPSFKTFFSSALHIVDLLALLPFYTWIIMDQIAPEGVYIADAENILQAVSILRVFRLLRLARRIKGLRVLLFAVRSSRDDVFLLILMLFIATVIFSSLMYYVDDREEFPSVLHGLWWAIVTMTTVGYGDQVPKTLAGKLLGSLCAITGVIIVALTVPVFVSKFQLYYNNKDKYEVKTWQSRLKGKRLSKTKIYPKE